MQISLNPLLTSNAAGFFSVESEGYIQGIALDDPAVRNQLAGGVYDPAADVPIWGGCAIMESIPTTNNNTLGGKIQLADTVPHMTGFLVFNQAHNAVNSPQSQAPVFAAGMTVNFYRFGSRARIAVKIDPALVSLEGGLINQQVSWDFANQQIVAFASVALPVKILAINTGNSKVVAYDDATGFANWVNNGNVAIIEI